MFLFPANANNDRLPDPKIQAGIAKVSGKVTNFQLKEGEEAPIVTFYVPNPVTAEQGKFKTHLSEDGSFNFEVPVECNYNIGHINLPALDYTIVSVGLIPGEVTKLEISYDEAGKIKANMVSSLGLISDDLLSPYKMVLNFLMDRSARIEPLYTMKPEDFSHYAIEKLMVERLKRSVNDSILSEKARNLITDECKLSYLNEFLLDYCGYMSRNYKNTKTKGSPDDFTPQEPGRSYYAFFKTFNFNDPQYLYNGLNLYTEVLQTILLNKTLNIPAIRDTSIKDWLKEVKAIMADLIGSDTGLFYDVLAANAYARQFNNELKSLSDKQKENIRSYFENEEITKILLKRNEEIIKLEKEKNYFNTVINSTPAVAKEALMNAIISKYKGKAVLVDFWATWCAPCMNAMKETREVKNEMKDKDIVFVYIADVSSPKKLWEEKINAIGGEHFYLTREEVEYLMDSFGFDAIPTYLFYGKNGIMKNKVTGYPGTETMQKMIEKLLQ
jgi:thiol-disulfide isomerase/thioredoxin